VGQVHADGSAFAEDRVKVIVLLEKLGPDAKWMIGGVPHAKHPLIAPDGAHRATNLIGEGLEGELVVGSGESGGNTVARAVFFLNLKEGVDGLLEVAAEKIFVACKGNGAGGFCWEFSREVEAVDCL
jgi:hypothetical protein